MGLNVDCTEVVPGKTIMSPKCYEFLNSISQDVCWSLYVGRDFCVPAPDPDFPMPVVDTALDQMPWIHGPPDPQVPIQPNYLTKTFEATCELLAISRRIMDVMYVPIITGLVARRFCSWPIYVVTLWERGRPVHSLLMSSSAKLSK